MHPEVINEVKDQSTTPAQKKQDIKANENGANVSKDAEAKKSKISDSGKKQKVKPQVVVSPQKENTRQSTIQKYFIRKQMEHYGYENFEKSVNPLKGFGFATPGVEV